MRKNFISGLLLILSLLLLLSLSILIFGLIYQNTLPKIVEELNNSSIGAILTAVITVFLLGQQTKSEELKERNVEVFKKKYEVFEEFIADLWKMFSDMKIDLTEYEQIINTFYQKIIFFLSENNLKKVADSICKIGNIINDEKNDSEKMQNEIFKIINILSEEISLGGKLDYETYKNINKTLLPKIVRDKLLSLYNSNLSNKILEKGVYDVHDGKTYIFHKFKNQMLEGCYLAIGPCNFNSINEPIFNKPFVGIWADGYLKSFNEYRHSKNGPHKYWLKGWMYFKDFEDDDIKKINYDSLDAINANIQDISSVFVDKTERYLKSAIPELGSMTVEDFLSEKMKI